MSPRNRAKDLLLHLLAWATLISLPSIVFSFSPKPQFEAVLSRYPQQVALVVAGRSSFSGDHTFTSRTYVLLPSVFVSPKAIQLRQSDGREVIVEELRGSFILFASILLVSITYYFYRRWTRIPTA